MNYELRRLDLLSVFKISFLVYLVIGFLIGFFYALIISQMMSVLSGFIDDQALHALGKITGASIIFVAIFLAAFMAIFWSILTVIAAAIYNFLAGSFGGIKMELNQGQVQPLLGAPAGSIGQDRPPSSERPIP